MIRYRHVKRCLDIVGSSVLLVATAPIMGVTAVLVRRNLGSPVIFRQARPGKDGEIFELMKFRSMLNVNEAEGLVTNEQRMTDFGRRLRSTSLDELPSLINVLRGDMSFVGPRPLMVAYLDRYTPTESRRHEVRPGITGLAQVNGRNLLAWSDRFKMDIEYVDSMSLGMDLKVLAKTVSTVFSRRGVTGEGQATMSEFMGTNEERVPA